MLTIDVSNYKNQESVIGLPLEANIFHLCVEHNIYYTTVKRLLWDMHVYIEKIDLI